jgi:hypothetical protein
MRKLISSIATLMLVLTLWSGMHSSVAHASEIGGCVTVVDGTSVGHTPGDADEVSRDRDKATPHHHNLNHAHEMGIPVSDWFGVACVHRSVKAGITPSLPRPPSRPIAT